MPNDFFDLLMNITVQPILDYFSCDEEDFKGRYGERMTENELKMVSMFGLKGRTLRNVYIPTDDGKTSEIDVMFICQKGIFVFESKNYSGWIFGNEDDQQWTSCLSGGKKYRFYNPIKQNRTHIKWLDRYINRGSVKVPLFSIIVFSERCELKKITVHSQDIPVIKRDKTAKTVKKIWDSASDVLSDAQVEQLYQRLLKLTKVDKSVKDSHIQDIENKVKGDPVTSDETGVLMCPRCGKPLVLRTASKGPNIGNQFYGCSGFPRCRYVRNFGCYTSRGSLK